MNVEQTHLITEQLAFHPSLIAEAASHNTLKIEVIDAIMGSGKTSAIIEYFKNNEGPFVYLSPKLSEVGGETCVKTGEYLSGRIQEALPELNFCFPTNKKQTKVESLRELILGGENIAATHQCFNRLNNDDIQMLKDCGYQLVIDEALEVIRPLDIDKPLVTLILESDYIKIRESDGLLIWKTRDFARDSSIKDLKRLAELSVHHAVYLVKDTVFITELPVELIKAFERVIVITYLFEHSIMNAWLKIHGLSYVDITNQFNLRSEEELKAIIREKLNFYTPKNECPFSLSHYWYNKATKAQFEKLAKNLSSFASYLRNKKIKCGNILVTSPKKPWENKKLKGSGYSRAKWVCSTTRATNEYQGKKAVIYAMAKNQQPFVADHLAAKEVEHDWEQWALSEILQLIWRGCIRNGEEMELYIVNPKTRKVIQNWLYS